MPSDLKFRYWSEDALAILPVDSVSFNPDGQPYPPNLMQFTGYQDKNGVDIYEGDIIDFEEGSYDAALVVWGYFTDCCVEGYTWRVEADIYQPTIDYRHDEAVIIGNRYENPELIAVKGAINGH